MSTPRETVDAELLLAQRAWVQRLAERLVADPAGADDAAQDTLVAALRRPPAVAAGERSLRAWLARVLRNRVRVGARSERRRRERETAAARPERLASAAEVVARAQDLRALVEAVLALDEPYRTVVLLAYFDGLPIAAIARRTDASPVAVRKRLSRGVATLRARLEGRYESRAALALALAGLVRPSGEGAVSRLLRPSLLNTTGVAMSWNAKAAVGAALVLGVVSFVAFRHEPEALRSSSAEPPGHAVAAVAAPTPEAPVAKPSEREALGAPAAATEPAGEEDEPAWPATTTFRGRCVADGAPLGGVALEIRETVPPDWAWTVERGTSGADGRFAIEIATSSESHLYLTAELAGYTGRSSAALGPAPPEAEVDFGDLHMPAACSIEGTVTSTTGAPVEGAMVRMTANRELPQDLPYHSIAVGGGLTSSAGYFIEEAVPATEWTVTVTRKGLRGAPSRVVDGSRGGLVRVDFTVETIEAIEGSVVDVRGVPVARAKVGAADAESGERVALGAVTCDQGRFTLQLAPGMGRVGPVLIGVENDTRWTCDPVAAGWGERGVLLVVEEVPAVGLRVVDAQTGAALTSYSYRICAEERFCGKRYDAQPTGGVERILCNPRGDTRWLSVLPPEPYAIAGPIELPPVSRAAEIVVELERAERLAVLTTDAAGEPLEGASVELVNLPPGETLAATRMIVDAHRASMFSYGHAWTWSAATTDAEGRAELLLPRIALVGLHVIATHEGARRVAAVDPDERACTLVFERDPPTLLLRYAGEWPWLASLRLVPLDDPRLAPVPAMTDRLRPSRTPEDRVTLGGAGLWSLRLSVRGGEFELEQLVVDGPRTLELRAQDHVLPERNVAVLVDGAPLDGGTLVLLDAQSEPPLELARVELVAGRAILPLLPRRSYRVRLADDEAHGLLDGSSWPAPNGRIDLRR